VNSRPLPTSEALLSGLAEMGSPDVSREPLM